MRTIYLECKMGVAGDMLASALLGLVEDENTAIDELNGMGIPGVEYKLEQVKKNGILGNHLTVMINGETEECHDTNEVTDDDISEHHHEHSGECSGGHSHEHHSLYEIEDIIESLNTSKEVKSDIREVYELLAEAESFVHGEPVDQIHFHEVGDLDAIADITAVCYLMHQLDPDRIVVSPINVGSGNVKCAHGILPVPAPATAHLLREIPNYESEIIKSELTTPTGAALIKYFADTFGSQPIMTVNRIGYGMGKKEFEQLNAVRALLGRADDENEQILEFSCNVDDMTAEEIGYATDALFRAGAVEVYTVSAGMKKGRPGIIIHCFCKIEDRDKILHEMFLNTTTIGIRENLCNRYVLAREVVKVSTPYGDIRVKKSSGYNITRQKPEYDDLAGIAARTGKSLIELKKELEEYC